MNWATVLGGNGYGGGNGGGNGNGGRNNKGGAGILIVDSKLIVSPLCVGYQLYKL